MCGENQLNWYIILQKSLEVFMYSRYFHLEFMYISPYINVSMHPVDVSFLSV